MAQLTQGNHRFRGWRRSADLVELAHAAPTDLKRTFWNQTQNEAARDSLNTQMAQLAETQVATLQHLRVQIQYRTQNDAG